MERIARLIENNRRWSERKTIEDPNFFVDLAAQQTPDFLWIGCSDSRVEASRIVGMSPGEIFVHRNVANLVVHTDINCLSVIQFAVEVLKIEHIIVCGHYGCGGVQAALETDSHGLIDNWLRNIRETAYLYASELNAIEEMPQKIDRLCELNVARQVLNVCETTIVRDAWNRGQKLMIHGWIYGLTDGLIRDLGHTNLGQKEAREFRTNFMAGRG
ncbi:MAG TPA: carbonate dehydratase [Pyrinomonadaceae bacterium]|nr:carbonate dehydratase [Pyrinomonadaceae bacterium]